MKRFWLFIVALSLLSCNKDNPLNGELTFTVVNSVIHANGIDAARFIVRVGDTDVTKDAEFYDSNSGAMLEVNGGEFVTNTPGTYRVQAAYGGNKSAAKTVTALSFAVPRIPADPRPESVFFKRRILIQQFTSTGCVWCPQMTYILRNLVKDPDYADKVRIVAVHGNMQSQDPAEFSEVNDMMGGFGLDYFPALMLNMELEKALTNSLADELPRLVDYYAGGESVTGICASSHLDGNTLVVKLGVKAASDTEVRAGCWVLEDGIYGKQSSAPDNTYNYHDNCLRLADSRVSTSSKSFIGKSIGRVAEKDVVEFVFMITLDESWNKDNCHLLLFTSVPKSGSTNYCIDNVASMPLNGLLPFEYNE